MKNLKKLSLVLLCSILLFGITGCGNEESLEGNENETVPTYQINLNDNIMIYQSRHSTLCGGWMFPTNASEILGEKIEITDTGYPRINVGSIEIAPHEWNDIYSKLIFDEEKENAALEKFQIWSESSSFGVGKFLPTFENHEFGYEYHTIDLQEPEKYPELNAKLEEGIFAFEKNIDTIFIQEGAYLRTGPCGEAYSEVEVLTEEICEEYHLNCGRW